MNPALRHLIATSPYVDRILPSSPVQPSIRTPYTVQLETKPMKQHSPYQDSGSPFLPTLSNQNLHLPERSS